jgi:hypothetical protein
MAMRLILVSILLAGCVTVCAQAGQAGTVRGDIELLSAIHDSMALVSALAVPDTSIKSRLDRSLAAVDSVRSCLSSLYQSAGYKTVLRAKGAGYWMGVKDLQTNDPPVFDAVQYIKLTANDEEVQGRLDSLGRLNLVTPVTLRLQEEQLKASIKQSQQKLDRYQKKYGPNSGRLNLMESAFNFYLLRSLALFGTGEDGPGPLEFIASYSTAYVATYDAETKKMAKDLPVVSAFELGARYYFLGQGWGEEGFCNGILKPGYATAGLMITGDTGGFMTWPLRGKQSYGVFASWGGFKAGYIAGASHRVLLSRQFQVVPYLF